MKATQPSPSPDTPSPASRWRQLGLVALTLAASGYLDLATGFEVSVFLVYVVPVALATRWLGPAWGSLTALFATAVWVWADQASGHQYSHAWFLYVNALNRLACFLLAVGVIRHVRARHRRLEDRLQALTAQLAVCTRCDKVSTSDHYWRTFEDHLREVAGVHPLHKVCPDCARRHYARAGYREPSQQTG